MDAAGSSDPETRGSARRALALLTLISSHGPPPADAFARVPASINPRRCAALCDSGALPILVAAVGSTELPYTRHAKPAHYLASQALQNVAISGEGRARAVIAAGAFPALAACLRRREAAVAETAARSIMFIAALGSSEARAALKAAAEVELLSASRRAEPAIADMAARALAALPGPPAAPAPPAAASVPSGFSFGGGSAAKRATKAPDPKARECAYCLGGPAPGAKLKLCGACKAVSYCSLSCQRSHWTLSGRKEACAAARGAAEPSPAP